MDLIMDFVILFPEYVNAIKVILPLMDLEILERLEIALIKFRFNYDLNFIFIYLIIIYFLNPFHFYLYIIIYYLEPIIHSHFFNYLTRQPK